ncbi:hypothetical protein [Alkalicoccobacillus plakortidis]|uniref:Flagellar hook-length control protein FliK n=1 Tax=Alkalicoccobacillus plakortidis TaxID=444060 RepID=A0ABT0XPD3_9BACI|nr:hypothetical protein [Alkalicoccobacillus plakortidis]MCM2677764.1 hypothetical protein [Alkalicoccobacillus plakortidis]
MQVNHLLSGNTVNPNRQLKQGDLLREATFEPISDTEAKITYRGKEMTVTVDGKMPQAGTASFVVTEAGENGIRVQEWTANESKQQTNPAARFVDLAVKAGVDRPTPLLIQAMKIAGANGQDVSRDTILALSRYLETSTSTDSSKLETVRSLMSKDLPINERHLKAVHEALHGRPVTKLIQELEQQLPSKIERNIPSLSKEQMLQLINQLTEGKNLTTSQQHFVDSVRASIIQGVTRESYQQLLTLVSETIDTNITPNSNPKEVPQNTSPTVNTKLVTNVTPAQTQQSIFHQLKHMVETKDNPQEAFESVKSIVQSTKDLAPDQSNRLSNQIDKAVDRLNNGRELAARQVFFAAVESEEAQLQTNVAQTHSEPEEVEQQTDTARTVIEAAGAVQIPTSSTSKQIAVTTVTEKMANVTNEFKAFQRETSRALRQINIELTENKQMDTQAPKSQLDAIIRKLDHSILRGDAMQFADMKTEKQLMMASSRLADARQLLASGHTQKAAQIVTQVQKQVDELTFKPSQTKVLFATNQQETSSRHAQSQVAPLQHFEEAAMKGMSGTARGVFEAVRQMGFNHEVEVAQQLSAKDALKEGPLSERNLKQSLLQLVNQHDEGSKTAQLANQALNNLSGQQLLSKQDAQPIQSLFFQLPLILEQKVEQLQCFIQSKKEGEQVDWQNCSLYFLMETPKLGEVGISVRVVQRQLSVTLNNDQADFKARMEPLVEKAISKVEAIGYSISSIAFSAFSEKQADAPVRPTSKPVYSSEKGFDFKI